MKELCIQSITSIKYLFKIIRTNEFKIYVKIINIEWIVSRNMDSMTFLRNLFLKQKCLIRSAAGKCLKFKD
jgi:hypothetical protein